MKSSAKLYFKGSTRVRILNGIHADNGSTIAPLRGSGTAATDVIFFVESANSGSISSYAVNISPKSSVAGTIYAPNGTIFISQETNASGAYLGKSITIGSSVQVSLASAFNVLNRPSAENGVENLAETSGAEGVPETYDLGQNYPNPFNPSTTISYALPEQGHVSLIVYDALGREVTRLVDNVESEGYHSIQWSGVNSAGSQVSTGVYFYRLQAGDFNQIRKMVLVK
jgi:hypothetical protein